MALLLPMGILAIGMLLAVAMYWLDTEYHGERLGILLTVVALLTPVAAIAYGLYGWLRFGIWGSISVGSVVEHFDIDITRHLYSPVAWRGVQQLSEWYLASNFAWSVFVLSIGVGLSAFRVASLAKERNRPFAKPRDHTESKG